MNKFLKIRHIKIKIAIISLVVVLCALSFIFQNQLEFFVNQMFNPVVSREISDSSFRLHFINVGQGDCSVVEFPDGKVMVIDSGTPESAETICFYLNSNIFNNKPRVIDYFVLTHSDSDHSGGASSLFDNYEIKNCFRPKIYTSNEQEYDGASTLSVCDNEYYVSFVNAMLNENCEVIYNYAGCEENYFDNDSNYMVEFLCPTQDTFSVVNDYSPVIRINCNGKSALFTGDISANIEEDLIENAYDKLDIDILKVAHHGSNSSSCDEFLTATSPEYSIISASKNNSYNLPDYRFLNRINDYCDNNKILRTDINGDIALGIDENSNVHVWNNTKIRILVYISWWYVVTIIIVTSLLLVFCYRKTSHNV